MNKLASQAAMNAAKISRMLSHPPTLDEFELISECSIALAKREVRQGFDWNNQKHDWETTCSRIAHLIEQPLDKKANGIVKTALEMP